MMMVMMMMLVLTTVLMMVMMRRKVMTMMRIMMMKKKMVMKMTKVRMMKKKMMMLTITSWSSSTLTLGQSEELWKTPRSHVWDRGIHMKMWTRCLAGCPAIWRGRDTPAKHLGTSSWQLDDFSRKQTSPLSNLLLVAASRLIRRETGF